jgi:hypothetical protein
MMFILYSGVNRNTNLFLSGERAECIQKYMSTRAHDKNKESIFILEEYIKFK